MATAIAVAKVIENLGVEAAHVGVSNTPRENLQNRTSARLPVKFARLRPGNRDKLAHAVAILATSAKVAKRTP